MGQLQLEVAPPRLEQPEVGYDQRGPFPSEAEPLAVPRASEVTNRGDEIEFFDKGAARLADDDDDFTARARYLRRPSGTGQTYRRSIVRPDNGAVQVGVAVQLGR